MTSTASTTLAVGPLVLKPVMLDTEAPLPASLASPLDGPSTRPPSKPRFVLTTYMGSEAGGVRTPFFRGVPTQRLDRPYTVTEGWITRTVAYLGTGELQNKVCGVVHAGAHEAKALQEWQHLHALHNTRRVGIVPQMASLYQPRLSRVQMRNL